MAPPANPICPETIEQEVLELHRQHARSLLRYAASMADDEQSAQDAVQEVFLRYLVERSCGRAISNPRAWLFQVLRNYLFDRKKAASNQAEVAGENVDGRADSSYDPETLMACTQMARTIAGVLSSRELECFGLRAEGLSYEEIGAAMEVRTGTVGVLLSRALEKIRRLRQQGVLGVVAAGVILAGKAVA